MRKRIDSFYGKREQSKADCIYRCLFITFVFSGIVLCLSNFSYGDDPPSLKDIEKRINTYSLNPEYKDDVYGLLVVKQALVSLKNGSGGIGACLVNEKTGKVVATGRNRQYSPYFRSDLHGEMDLLTRWEDWLRKKGGKDSDNDPRKCENLVLISSMEPCPMCLTRIINSGIKKMYYLAEDSEGGMVTRMDSLPPFWKKFAEGREFRLAECSPELRKISEDLFNHSMRLYAKNKEKTE